LFGGNGAFYYNSTNISGTAFDANTYQYVSSYPVAGSRSYTPAAGDYFGSVITTNRFQQVNGPVLVSAYLTSTGGAANSAYSVHPEIYYTYDTNSATLLGDYESGNQTIIHGAVTNRYDFAVAFPPIVSTNANGFWLVRRFKVNTKVGADTLTLSLGTNGVDIVTSTPSSISFTQPAQAGANWVASGATNSTLAGTASTYNVVATNSVVVGGTIGAGSNLLETPELYTGSFKLYRGALTPVDAGTQLDFASTNRYWSCTLTGAVTFTTANLAAGKHANVMITGVATNAAFTWPAGWIFIGYKPTYLTANKHADLYLKATSNADAGVWAYYGEEQ
jgi:hypothetical protein